MREVPGRLVGRPQVALELHGANALLRVHHQRHGGVPFLQGEMRIVENRAFGYGELFFALAADIEDSGRKRLGFAGSALAGAVLLYVLRYLLTVAVRAFRAIRPAHRLQKIVAGFWG